MKKVNEITLKQLYEAAYGTHEPFVNYKNTGTFTVTNMLAYLLRREMEENNEIGALDIYAYLLYDNCLDLVDLEYCAEELMLPESYKSFDIALYKTYCSDILFDKTRKAFKKMPEYLLEKIGLEKADYGSGESVHFFSYQLQELLMFAADREMYYKVADSFYNLREGKIPENCAKTLQTFIDDAWYSCKNKVKYKDFIDKWVKKLGITIDKVRDARKELILTMDEDRTFMLEEALKGELKIELTFDSSVNENVFSLEKLNSLDNKVVGQENAIKKIKSRLLAANLGFKQEKQPIASFLLTGPTGVGKTETAKAVADACFDGKLYVVDMSTFKSEIDVSRLTGGSPNYVGYSDKNTFCDFIKENPNCVVLFDEAEKAHRGCLDLVMRILDEGQFINAKGEVISFENTVIFCTTNLTQNTVSTIGFGSENNTEENVTKDGGFKKEIVGRFSDVIEYKSLEKDDCKKIAKAFLNKIIKSFEQNNTYNIKLRYTDDLLDEISNKSNTKLLGARDLKKTIQSEFINVVAAYIVENQCLNVTLVVSSKGVKKIKSTQKSKSKELDLNLPDVSKLADSDLDIKTN
ncbi:MAG: ATP-dependent Clp protease ATP-binding subunit [Clostridiales bacterium]|nr:ATP-dependent Clp protease ATP-binding subunit [Clostridiales bacterium]